MQFNNPGVFTVRFTAIDALGAISTAATRIITVLTGPAGLVSRTGWTLKYVDSQQTGYGWAKALDGNNSSMWFTQWTPTVTALPHEMQINLGAIYNLTGFQYLPRQDSSWGRIGQYEFYVSSDGVNWGTAVATGTFANDAVLKEVHFTGTHAQYMRLRALSSLSGSPYSSVAELNAIGTFFAALNQPPSGTIGTPTGDALITAGGSVNFTGSGTDPDGNLPLTYHWTFGAGSGVADSTAQNPGAVQFNTPGTYTVSFTVTDSLGGVSTAATRTITVLTPASGLVPRTGWTLKSVDSQQTGYAGAKAFDGNAGTMWFTQWTPTVTALPHEIQINLGALYSVTGFQYLPRQDTSWGRIGQYEFYVSTDGVNWGTPVAAGTFANDALMKEVHFSSTHAQYIRLRALSSLAGSPYSSVAELYVIGGAPDELPVASIDTPASAVTITAGDSVNFTGSGTDPDNNLPLTFHWTFGAGSGIADSTAQNPGMVQFNTPGLYTVSFTVTDSLGGVSTAATRTVTVLTAASGLVPRTAWTVLYVDSQQPGYEATKSFDGVSNSMWFTQWTPTSPPLPHEIQIDMGAVYQLTGFQYLPRQDISWGRIGNYEFYVSTDGVNWGTAAATGTFANDALMKEVHFTSTSARYIRLRALSSLAGSPYSSVAELKAIGTL